MKHIGQLNMTDSSRRTPTSMNLDGDLWERVRIAAIKRRTTATELVEEALRHFLDHTADGANDGGGGGGSDHNI
jgi:hypothetical protein